MQKETSTRKFRLANSFMLLGFTLGSSLFFPFIMYTKLKWNRLFLKIAICTQKNGRNSWINPPKVVFLTSLRSYFEKKRAAIFTKSASVVDFVFKWSFKCAKIWSNLGFESCVKVNHLPNSHLKCQRHFKTKDKQINSNCGKTKSFWEIFKFHRELLK